MIYFCILEDFERLDSALYVLLGDRFNASRSQIAKLLESKLVFVNGTQAKKSRNLKKGDEIKITLSKSTKDSTNSPLDTTDIDPIQIIHESTDYLVLNKPQNLVVHAAPSVKEKTLCDYLLKHNFTLSNLAGNTRLGIVHRLDKDTSGAILVAKTNAAHAHFSDMLKARKMGRIYLCVVSPPLKENTIIECYLGRSPHNRLKISRLDKARFPKARDSKSEFRKIMQSVSGKYELISVRLFSGRTHQIRAHLDSINRHIYGDSLYSPANLTKGYKCKMLLHAYLLYFEGKIFLANLPLTFSAFLKEHFGNYETLLETHLQKWIKELQTT